VFLLRLEPVPIFSKALCTYFQGKLPLPEIQLDELERLFTPHYLAQHEVLVWQDKASRYGAFVVQDCLHGLVTDVRQKELGGKAGNWRCIQVNITQAR